MKKRVLFIVLAILIGAGVLLAIMWWMRPEPVDVVRSDDGTAELRIPVGALPMGVSLDAIQITRVETESEGLLASYELTPSGTLFEKPVSFVVDIPLGEQPAENTMLVSIPTFVSISGDRKEADALETTLDLDASANLVRASAPLQHFSTINVLTFSSARIDNPSDHQVGDSFFVGARMTLDRTSVTVPIANDPDYVAYVHSVSDWYLWSGQFTSKAATTTPEKIEDVPKSLTPEAGTLGKPSHVVAGSFMCVNGGDAGVNYRVFADAKMAHFIQDRTGATTEFQVKNEDISSPIHLATRPFRCIEGEETIIAEPPKEKDEVLIGNPHDVVQTRYGQFDVQITPSATRVVVGQSLNVDVVVTDISDRVINLLPVASRPAYVGPWSAWGVWFAAPIFDRTEVGVDEPHQMNYLGRLTFRLPLTCKTAGKGSVIFGAEIIKSREGGPNSLFAPMLGSIGGSSVQTGTIECVDPVTEKPPQTEPVRLTVEPINLFATHAVGSTSCPQSIGTFTVVAPPGVTWTADGIPPWIRMPSSGTDGSVPVQFNCNITNYDSHEESAAITFTAGEETATVNIRMDIKASE